MNTYNSDGTLQSVIDSKGNKTSYSYDLFKRLIKSCYPLAASVGASSATDCENITYDTVTINSVVTPLERIKTLTRRDNQVISFGYDPRGRISSNSGAITEIVSYNNFSLVTSHTNNGLIETYGYNGLGLKTSDEQSAGKVNYEYDIYGRRNKLTYPSGQYVTYSYNDGDELIGIYENGTAALATFDYDNYGRRAHLYRGNGQTTTYGFDTSSRLTSLSQVTTNSLTFTYTEGDQIKSRTNSNAAFGYTPTVQQLTYGINGLNQIADVSGSALGYDGRGNLNSDGSNTYVYNVKNLLSSATQSGATSTLSYDAEDRLLTISKNGTTTTFLYDGLDLIAEYNGTTLIRSYVHGPGSDEPLVAFDQVGTKTWLHADNLGSITSITTAAGVTSNINLYDEYGMPNSSNTGRFQYTGQAWLPEIGMYNYKARLYNPVIGRFMQTDPIGYGDGMNMYNYVHSDPINGRDPLGLSDTTVVVVTGNRSDSCPIFASCFRGSLELGSADRGSSNADNPVNTDPWSDESGNGEAGRAGDACKVARAKQAKAASQLGSGGNSQMSNPNWNRLDGAKYEYYKALGGASVWKLGVDTINHTDTATGFVGAVSGVHDYGVNTNSWNPVYKGPAANKATGYLAVTAAVLFFEKAAFNMLSQAELNRANLWKSRAEVLQKCP